MIQAVFRPWTAAKVEEIVADSGKALAVKDVKAALQRHKPAVLFLCQGESSSGVQQSLAGEADREGYVKYGKQGLSIWSSARFS